MHKSDVRHEYERLPCKSETQTQHAWRSTHESLPQHFTWENSRNETLHQRSDRKHLHQTDDLHSAAHVLISLKLQWLTGKDFRSRNRHSPNRTERDQTQRSDNRWASRLKTKQQKVRESIVRPSREALDELLTLEMICMKNHQMRADQVTPANRDRNDSSSRTPGDPANIWEHQMNESICFRDSRLAHFTTNSIPVRLVSLKHNFNTWTNETLLLNSGSSQKNTLSPFILNRQLNKKHVEVLTKC